MTEMADLRARDVVAVSEGGIQVRARVEAVESEVLIRIRREADGPDGPLVYFPRSSIRLLERPPSPKIVPKKRKLEFAHGGEDFDYSIGDEVEWHDTCSEEIRRATVRSVKPNEWVEIQLDQLLCRKVEPARLRLARKRPRGSPLVPVWLACSMEYLGAESTWAERHTLERSWMLHTGAQHPYYAESNDRALAQHIRRFFEKHLGLKDPFWEWMKRSAVFTGSAIVALAHGADPFANPWSLGGHQSDIDIFTATFFAADAVFGIDPKHQPRRTVTIDDGCRTVRVLAGGSAYRIDMHYSKYVDRRLDSRKYRVGYSNNHILNIIRVPIDQDTSKTAPSRQSTQNSAEAAAAVERPMSETKAGPKQQATDEKSEEYVGKPLRHGETLHEYCLREFDLDLLAVTYDGTAIRVGDGSMEARDRLAALIATYQRDPASDRYRVIERCVKYIQRGVFIQNFDTVMAGIRTRMGSLHQDTQPDTHPHAPYP